MSLFFYKFIYLYFIFGRIGSLLPCTGFSLVAVSGGHSSLWCAGFSLRWPRAPVRPWATAMRSPQSHLKCWGTRSSTHGLKSPANSPYYLPPGEYLSIELWHMTVGHWELYFHFWTLKAWKQLSPFGVMRFRKSPFNPRTWDFHETDFLTPVDLGSTRWSIFSPRK